VANTITPIRERTCSPEGKTQSPITFRLQRRICAIKVERQHNGEPKFGTLTQLEAGSRLELCGQGYTPRMMKVCVNYEYYFVFKEDLDL